MSTLHILVLTFWLGPAAIVVSWTLLSAYFGYTRPLATRVPLFASFNLLLMVHNPKDDYLYQRPSWRVLVVLVTAALVPLVAFLYLAAMVLFVLSLLHDSARRKQMARTPS